MTDQSQTLRRMVFISGLTLPALLWLQAGLQPSISAYYWTGARDSMVGNICFISAFLGAYGGYDLRDRIVTAMAGASGTGVAMFPMAAPGADGGWLHFACAAVFFVALAYLCIFQFTQSSGAMTDRKKRRNVLYRLLGRLILVGLVAMSVVSFAADRHPAVFWIETAMVLCFSLAFGIKGDLIPLLKDKA